jgi:hypothetical protein
LLGTISGNARCASSPPAQISFIKVKKGNARPQERTPIVGFVSHCRFGWALLSVVTLFYGNGGTKFPKSRKAIRP